PNDEPRKNAEIPNTTGTPPGPVSRVRISRFGLLSSFVIRHSDFKPPPTLSLALAEYLRPGLRQSLILAPAHLEWRALHDFQNQRREFVTAFGQALRDLVHGALVVVLEAAAQGIGQHFFGKATQEIVALALQQKGCQLIRPVERFPGDQLAGGVNGEIPFLVAPFADAVEILQAKTDRIHARMAGSADGVLPVLLHARA